MKRTPIVLALLAALASVRAELVYNNYTSSSGGGNATNAFASDSDDSIAAIRFTLTEDVVIESLNFTGCYISQYSIPRPGNDQFTVAFFQDDGSTDPANPAKPIPGPTVGAVQTLQMNAEPVDRGDTIVFSLPTFDYAGNLPQPVTLDAGTYWVSISNDYSGEPTWGIAYAFSGSNSLLAVALSSSSQTSGYVGFPTNDPIRPFLSLSGTPAPPKVSVADETPTTMGSGDLIELGKVLNGSTVTRTFTVTNDETDPLTISTFDQQSNSPGTFVLSGLTPPLELAPETSTTFEVAFSPTTEGVAYATRLFLGFDGYPGVEFELNFNGEGVDSAEGYAYDVCVVAGYDGTDALPGADPDGDGLPNLASYGLGLDYGHGPQDDDGVHRPLVATGTTGSPASGIFGTAHCHLPEPQPTDVIYILEESSTLSGAWSEIARRQHNGPWTGSGADQVTTEVLPGGLLRCSVVFSTSVTTEPTRFMRMRFELRP